MQKDWLKRQLTTAKQGSPLWGELAEAIQELVDQHALPLVERLKNMKSAFTMSEPDIDRKIDELGRFFAIRAVTAEIKPIVFMQRLDEIHLKDTEYPLINTLWREFGGLSVRWAPLYAPVDLKKYPYGSVLITKDDSRRTGGMYGDMFLTSRGVIRLPLNEIMRTSQSDDFDQVVEGLIREIKVYVEPLLPLHIVFDGHQLELIYTIKEAEEWLRVLSECITEGMTTAELVDVLSVSDSIDASGIEAFILRGGIAHEDCCVRFDQTPVDCWSLDNTFLPFYFDDTLKTYTLDPLKSHIYAKKGGDSSVRLTTQERITAIKDIETELAYPAAVPLAECADLVVSMAIQSADRQGMRDAAEIADLAQIEVNNLIAQRERVEGVSITAGDVQTLINRVNYLIENDERVSMALGGNSTEGMNVQDKRSVIRDIDTRQIYPMAAPLSECADLVVSVALQSADRQGLRDAQEVALLVRGEINNLLSQREKQEGVSVTAGDVESLIAGVNRRMEHEGHNLRFDVTPLDQCMLDSGHFEP